MQNKKFAQKVDWLRDNVPGWARFLIASNYLMCAIVGGMFLQPYLTEWGYFLSFAVAFTGNIVAQAIRASVIFTSQLNPMLVVISNAWKPQALIVLLACVAGYEVYSLSVTGSLPVAASVMFCGWVALGSILELQFLAELRRHTKAEFLNDPSKIEQLQNYLRTEAMINNLLKDLDDDGLENNSHLPVNTAQLARKAMAANGNGKGSAHVNF